MKIWSLKKDISFSFVLRTVAKNYNMNIYKLIYILKTYGRMMQKFDRNVF